MISEKKESSYGHILKYTSLFGGIQGLNMLIGLVRNKLVAIILGPQGMGLISLFNTSVKLISDSTNLGLSMSAVKNLSEAYESGDEERLKHMMVVIRMWSLLTALVGVFFAFALSPLLNNWTFNWGDHTLHFVLLSPIVGMMAITGGEMAILKATRHLRRLAVISVFNVLLALFTSVPIYYLMGERGIVPSLVVIALSQMLLTIYQSFRLYPYRIQFSRQGLSDGMDMVRLGIAFVLAGVMGSGADFIIRSFLNNVASLDEVGLYNAGYMMTMVYAGMVFSAMETDYFPRLSAVNNDSDLCRLTVNRQIEVSLLLIAPMLVAFIVAIPILLPLLYSRQFLPAIGMVQVMSLALYFRALKLPLSYIPLAKGDSWSYLFLEMLYDILIVVMVIVLFRSYGLLGAGIAITATGILEYGLLLIYTRVKYAYCPSREVLICSLIQIPIGFAAYLTVITLHGWMCWLVGGVLFAISLYFSIRILQQKTSMWKKLTSRFPFLRRKE
ncbi:MAG: oligosaccharide flippase family protein [Prevotella sp.]|nr:oligosaccharide flippase family protein [Prevotella sp.]